LRGAPIAIYRYLEIEFGRERVERLQDILGAVARKRMSQWR
jgi:hypothetical protein